MLGSLGAGEPGGHRGRAGRPGPGLLQRVLVSSARLPARVPPLTSLEVWGVGLVPVRVSPFLDGGQVTFWAPFPLGGPGPVITELMRLVSWTS